ncbi:MAG: hypothetical protein GX621_18965 [Pirellulaceae bacterium]|nr:hypothetical protein [Pirellulaceae bacterium]
MKRIVIEFQGGPWDGRIADSLASDQEDYPSATACYRITNEGTIGHGFDFWPPSQIEHAMKLEEVGRLEAEKSKCPGNHRYIVTAKTENDNSVQIRMDYSVAAEKHSTR